MLRGVLAPPFKRLPEKLCMSGDCTPRLPKAIFVVTVKANSDTSGGKRLALGWKRTLARLAGRTSATAGTARPASAERRYTASTIRSHRGRGYAASSAVANPVCCHPHLAWTCPPGHGPAKSSTAVTFVKMDVDLSLWLPCLHAAKVTTVICLASSANPGSCHIHEFVGFSMLSPTRGWHLKTCLQNAAALL